LLFLANDVYMLTEYILEYIKTEYNRVYIKKCDRKFVNIKSGYIVR